MAKFVIFGGSGMIGQRAVREALGRGHEVAIVVRDPSKVAETHPNLTVATGDATDPGTVAKLAAGADTVISAIAPPRGVPGSDPAAALTAVAEGLI